MRRWSFGPGLLVTAAFIGPGTVTTASEAGAKYGFALLWVVLLAIVATVSLQTTAARLGLVARLGLGEALMQSLPWRPMRFIAAALVIAAIGFGNAAYQTGNLTGAGLGLATVSGWPMQWELSLGEESKTLSLWPALMGVLAFGLLFSGAYRVIERVLIGFVVVMSVAFVLAAVLAVPDWGSVLQGLFVPRVPAEPQGAWLTILALVGTTIVPYNLFLHASAVQKKWSVEQPLVESLRQSQVDSTVAISLGGLMTAAMVVSAAVAFYLTNKPFVNVAAMADGLAPVLGAEPARWLFGSGLFAAGLTSAITAPLAAAFATAGVLGWPADLKSFRFRAVWMVVLLTGTLLACWMPRSPEQMIVIAQAANGVLLPLMIGFLLLVVNRRQLMGKYRPGWLINAIVLAVWVLSLLLTARTFVKLWG